jgi:chromosome segregation ATPase
LLGAALRAEGLMTNIERVSAYIAVAVFLVGVGISWNALNNRIDKVDEKIAAIQKTLGSTTCNAILTRQIEAIEKNRADARKALEALSAQYDCVPRKQVSVDFDMNAMSYDAVNVSADTADLNAQLNAVDVLLNNGS